MTGFDYSTDALYFVTLCVQDRVLCLGEINQGIMHQNTYGQIAEKQWHWLAEQYTYVVLHAFVIMPNHVHGILEINRRLALEHGQQPAKIKSLSELMGAYKTTSSKQIRLAGLPEFAWQRSFHDHIIRNEYSYNKIADYIAENPANWNADLFYA